MRRTHARLRAGRWTLAAAVFGSAMALGAVHTPVLLISTAVLLGAVWLVWQGAEPARPRPAATLLLWTCIFLTGFTALQTLPLPMPLLRVLSPQSADIWTRALLPLHEPGPSWGTLSVDPLATRVQVVRGVAYFLTFIAAVRIANRREGVFFLEGALVATGLALAVASWVHPALGVDKVFGVYRPIRDPGVRHIAPILNSNVLSGYLNIPLCLVFGHAVAKRPTVPRPISLAVTAFLLATQLWLASRGGMIGAVLGLVMVLWLSRAPGPGERSWARGVVPVALVLTGVAMGVLSASEASWAELADSDVSKLDLAWMAFRLVPLFPVFGAGRGAFETTFPAVRSDAGHMVYTHPENLWAQWATEWGPAASIVAGVAILVALRPRSATTRSPRAAGAWAALAALGVQNLVDFSSEYPGVVIALTVCAALVAGGTSGVERGGFTESWAKAPRKLVWASSAAAAFALVLGVTCLGGDLHDDRERLRKDALDATVGRDAFRAEEHAAILRHPAEPYLPFLGAVRAYRAKDDSVIAWVERTLERARVYGPAHLVLARSLVPRAPAQARLEYRLATEQAPEIGAAQVEALRLVGGYDDAREIVAHGNAYPMSLAAVIAGVGARLPATAARLDLDLGRADPKSVPLATRQASSAVTDLEAGVAAPWCDDDRKACIARAMALADRVVKLNPGQCQGYELHARAVFHAGDAAAAVKELGAAVDKVVDRTACLQELALLASAARLDPVLSDTLEQIIHSGCSEAKECAANIHWAAELERSRGNSRRALVMLQKAHDRSPENDDILVELAGLASSVDLHSESLRAYEELSRRHPQEVKWQEAAAAERAAVVRSSARL